MAAQQPQQNADSGMGPIWVIVGLFLASYVIWQAGHQHIVKFVFALNILEAKLIQFFIGSAILTSDIGIMENVDPTKVTWDELYMMTNIVGEYLRYPAGIFLAGLAAWLYKSDYTLKYHRAHNMKSLSLQEQHNWTAIMPVVNEDLVSQDINVGPWAMAMTPMEFARKYDLLKKDDILLDKSTSGQEMTGGVRRGDAKRVFTLQLGPYWYGFEHCPPHARALAAAFMARLNRDRDSATKILITLNQGSQLGKMDYSVADSVIRKHQNAENVQLILSNHAYFLTVMATLLKGAREDGVFATSEFLWLKKVDRRLWYMMNCVGRQTPFAEVAGPFAHWRAEQVMGRRCLVPMIDEAIKALEIAIKEVKLSPKEMQELKP